jgi:isochorismate synthase EntC
VEAVREFMLRACEDVIVEDAPQVLRLSTIQHLRTRLSGVLGGARSPGLLNLAGQLHPTPAMGGVPRDAALSWLRRYEGIEREWFAALLGWLDTAGDGELAVAIRCALINGPDAVLFAGCGIVEGSVAELEYRETAMKLQVMLSALGLELTTTKG